MTDIKLWRILWHSCVQKKRKYIYNILWMIFMGVRELYIRVPILFTHDLQGTTGSDQIQSRLEPIYELYQVALCVQK